jgi:hypothetical protein
VPEQLWRRLHIKIQIVRQIVGILLVGKQGDKTADYAMLFIVWVINTIVPTKKSKPLIFAFLF